MIVERETGFDKVLQWSKLYMSRIKKGTEEKMKKILMATILMAAITGCSSFRKKDSSGIGTESPVKTETTAGGESESLDGSPLNLSATGSDSGKIDGLRTIFFEYDKSAIISAEKEKLAGNVEWIKKNSKVKVTVEGHCDQRGSAEYNLALGERRANAIKQALVSKGIPAGRLTTVSFGKEKLLSNDDSEDGMAKNRRANFVPVSK